MKEKHFIFGASGHGKVVIDILQSTGIFVDAIIDDNPKSLEWQNIPIHHSTEVFVNNKALIILAIGNNATRKKIFSNNSFHYFKAIHKQTTIAESVTIGEGSVIMAQVVVNAGAIIGNHCILNSICN